ncbi:glycosyltransferase family 4 protein [Massilia sp. YIM B02763]|uniref:glycosyltransferase family 4 protein n=1 Tax=Massilia sp. YIM B02763 TaxID=3050130 RepID=UPI0025B63706|nr:glycosyltransferase family 4 protein [Massilia sp. YIM B02763]MDN4053774.1 glycosyltransferase family 4 protein [Massilia sp. YIM B02763]
MKLLTFSSLFPNTVKPSHGIFVETRLRYLLGSGQVASRVVAPVPWFPSNNPRFGDYAAFSRVPAHEVRYDIEVSHPRYPVIPKVGMTVAPWLMAQACKKEIGRIIDEGYDFDAIDAHYFYPDGVAAVMLGKYFNKPVVITARGTDINLIPQYALPRKQLMWAANNAAGMITVCNALRDEMIGLGIPGERIVALRNGVDLQRFQPLDRQAARASLGIDGFTVISVGVLDPRKAHDLTIGALPMMPDVKLLIAGIGPERKKLEGLAERLGVADRVKFLGAVAQPELKNYYNAADAMVLASSREGWANVLLESMACGTPVVASNVWGTPEVVAAPEAGVLMKERTARGIAEGIAALRAAYPDHAATRRYAEGFSWDATTEGQLRLFGRIIGERRATAAVRPQVA